MSLAVMYLPGIHASAPERACMASLPCGPKSQHRAFTNLAMTLNSNQQKNHKIISRIFQQNC